MGAKKGFEARVQILAKGKTDKSSYKKREQEPHSTGNTEIDCSIF
jgi:hypothetical protein